MLCFDVKATVTKFFIKSRFMIRIFISLLLLFITFTCFAQEKNNIKDTTVKEISLDEVVISASNFAEKKKNIAQKIDVISAQTIAQINAQNMGDLLINTGKSWYWEEMACSWAKAAMTMAQKKMVKNVFVIVIEI